MKKFAVILVLILAQFSFGAYMARKFVGENGFNQENSADNALTWEALNEDLVFTFSANTMTGSSTTGVATLDLPALNVGLMTDLQFEGATANAHEAIIRATDPTADTIWTIPVAAAGTYCLMSSTLATNAPDVANSVYGTSNALTFEGATANNFETSITVTDPTADRTITLPDASGTVLLTGRASQQYTQSIAYAKLGASGAGWVIGAADSISLATLPESQTNENMVIPVTIPLKVGSIITGFTVNGQMESAGGTATLDASLRKMTAAAGDFTDAEVGALAATLSKTADYKIADGNSLLNETVAADETFYVLVEGTTAASTDIAIGGITITVTEP
jgi:hypothetical protein